jgi:hypothetical protein
MTQRGLRPQMSKLGGTTLSYALLRNDSGCELTMRHPGLKNLEAAAARLQAPRLHREG